MNAIIIFGAKYLVYILIALAVLCFFIIGKNRRREMLIFAAITLPLAYVLAKLSSLLYYDPRPFVVGPPAGGFVPLIPHVADNGFPSDHMLLASAVAAVIFRFEKKWGILLFVLACAVGISRVLAGVHHFVDILGGVIAAIFAAYVVHCYMSQKFSRKG